MSEILGHDVNGRPLRAGDRVVIVRSLGPVQPGTGGRIEGAYEGLSKLFPDSDVRAGFDGHGSGWGVASGRLRRLDDRTDHQPSEYTYDELLDSLKTGAPNHAKA